MVPIGNTSTSVGAVVKWEREREKWWFSWGDQCTWKGTHIEVGNKVKDRWTEVVVRWVGGSAAGAMVRCIPREENRDMD